jgi:F-type H+-transporting ATPase subunit a
MRDKATSILSWKFVKECSVGKTNADVKISLLSLKSKGAELKKMDLPYEMMNYYYYYYYYYLPVLYTFPNSTLPWNDVVFQQPYPQSVFFESNGIVEEVADNFVYLTNANSPLDQFAIHPILPFHIDKFYLSFTNLSLSMLLTLCFVLLGFFLVTKKGGGKSVPNALQSLVEQIYDFVLNLVNEQIGGLSGNVKQKFFPCISVTFTFSLFRNPQGMIPFSFTVTSHFLITLALSFSIFIGITIVGFQRHGLHFFSFLLPAGVPLALAPFLVLLELISYCFRALSLGIRLFANMMAGHSLVKILSGFAWTMLFLNNIFYFIGDLGPLFIILALTGLELGVAISQAHVSTISICIYLNDALNLH